MFLWCNTIFAQEQSLPSSLIDRVNDYANLMSSEQQNNVRNTLASIEKQSSAQVVLVTVNVDDAENFDIESFSIKWATQWKIGQRGVDNGVLILICPNVRKSRIEVGYGLEGILTDAFTHQLQQQHFNPNFRKGDYYTGIYEVVNIIKDTISPEAQEQLRLKKEADKKASQEATDAFLNFLLWFAIIGLSGGLIGWYIYSDYVKRKKAEEERLAEERRKKEEEQRIIRNAEAEEQKLKKHYESCKSSLQQMQNFKDANLILPEVTKIYEASAALLTEALYKDYSNICQNATDKINKLCQKHINDFRIKTNIEKERNNFFSSKSQLQHRLVKACEEMTIIFKAYDNAVWGNDLVKMQNFYNSQTSHETMLKEASSSFEIALQKCQTDDFQAAQTICDETCKKINVLSSYCDKVFEVQNNIKRAINDLNVYNQKNSSNVIRDNVEKVTKYFKSNSSDLSSRLKNDWNDFAKANTHFIINVHTRNPLLELARIQKFMDDLDSFYKKAKSEVDEEQRRRRRREEEEEERRRSSYSTGVGIGLSSSYDDSSSSSSSSSSSFDSGGGSFGGGGSSDSW